MSRARALGRAVTLLALAGTTAGLLATEGPPGGAPARVATRPVLARTLGCPAVPPLPAPQAQLAVATTTAAALPPGAVTIRPLGPGPVRRPAGGPVVSDPGLVAAGDVPVAVQVHGPAAGGAAAGVMVTAGGGRLFAGCSAPVTDSWLVGAPGGTPGSVLRLLDVDPVPAVVDISVATPAGTVAPSVGQGVGVAAFGSVNLPLDQLAGGQGATAVHVVARTGRIVAAVLDVTAGADLVAADLPPAGSGIVAGLPAPPAGTTASVSAVLANPGTRPAAALVSVRTAAGTDPVRRVGVAPGGVVTVDLTAALGGRAGAFAFTADAPLLAAAAVALTGPGAGGVPARDVAYLPATPVLLSAPASAVLADWRSTPGSESTLLVTVTDAPATLVLSPIGSGGGLPAARRISLPAGVTTTDLGAVFAAPVPLGLAPAPGSPPIRLAVVSLGPPGPVGITGEVPEDPGPRVDDPPVGLVTR